MKKKWHVQFIALVTLTFTLLTSVPVFSSDVSMDTGNKSDFTFSQSELRKELQKAVTQPVYGDKGAKGLLALTSERSSGTYPTRRGVILVTADKYKGLIPLGHAAIVWTSTTVVESLSEGVTTGRNDWHTTQETCYGVTTNNTTTDQDSQAASYCYNQIGKPYNYNYPNKWTRDKFYCSQLVYAAYKDLFSIDLDTISFLSAVHPMELVNTDKTYTIYTK